jgi:hypothetical protein
MVVQTKTLLNVQYIYYMHVFMNSWKVNEHKKILKMQQLGLAFGIFGKCRIPYLCYLMPTSSISEKWVMFLNYLRMFYWYACGYGPNEHHKNPNHGRFITVV